MGFENKNHNKQLEFKKQIYEKQNKKVIFTNQDTLTDFKSYIKKQLKIN